MKKSSGVWRRAVWYLSTKQQSATPQSHRRMNLKLRVMRFLLYKTRKKSISFYSRTPNHKIVQCPLDVSQNRVLGVTAFLIAVVLDTLRKQNHVPLLRANTTDLFKVVSLKKKSEPHCACERCRCWFPSFIGETTGSNWGAAFRTQLHLLTYLLTYLLTCLLTYLLHGAESFLRR